MKKEKNKYFKDKYKFAIKVQNQKNNKSKKLEINLSCQTKIKIKDNKKILNNIEYTSPKNKKSISPNQSNLSKDKIYLNNFLKIEKQKNNNNSQKNSIKKNSSSIYINILNKDESQKAIKMKNESNINNNSTKKKDFYNKKKTKLKSKIIQSSITNNDNSKNYNTSNNLNLIYTNNEQYNNDLFSNLFIDTSSDNKNILVSELDIELSNIDQSNCNKKNDKSDIKNINIIEDEEDTNQKSNEHMDIYKKIELRFKSKLEKSLNNYFKKNGTNFYIGDSISKQLNKEIENYNKSKSNKKFENSNEDKKINIKKLINSDRKLTHNINFTKDLREHKNNKTIKIIESNKLKLLKNKLKENENNKKFQKIISFKTMKFKINNNNLKNKKNSKKNSKKDSKKDSITKNRIIKQKKNLQSKTKTIIGEKKISGIYSKIINDANIIKDNKNKRSKEKDIYTNRSVNKYDKNNDNNILIRQSYKNSPYYLHSINTVKDHKNNNLNYNYKNNFKYDYNQLYHKKYKNNKINGEMSIVTNNLNKKKKNREEINLNRIKYNNNNISYLNNKTVKNNNKLNILFSYFGNDEKDRINNQSQKSKLINKDYYQKRNEQHKKNIKSHNYKIKEKTLKYYKGLNTEVNHFKTIKFFNINKEINKTNLFCNKKANNGNMKNKFKSDIYKDKNIEKSVFFYNRAFFLSPNKNRQLLQHNSFKKNLINNL